VATGSLTPRRQDFALVGEVAEERALGQPRPRRDFGDRRLFEAALLEQL